MEPEKYLILSVIIGIVVVGIVVGVSLLTFEGSPNGGNGNTTPEFTTIVENRDLISLKLQAPNWELELSDGETLELDSLRGRLVIVDLMATWCSPCTTQSEYLQEIYNDYGNAIWILSLTVDLSETGEMMADFKEQHGAEWDHGIDSDNVFSNYFNVESIPTLVIIDSEGYFRWKHVGVWPVDNLRSTISSIFS
jgi:thiol-disulfide isomerase/thioredoxin